MLNSRKGNLICFQWEIERFQKSHREKMDSVVPVMNTKPDPKRQQNRATTSRGSVREKLAESDIKRQNAFLVEQMAHIYHTGGFQRRWCLVRGRTRLHTMNVRSRVGPVSGSLQYFGGEASRILASF